MSGNPARLYSFILKIQTSSMSESRRLDSEGARVSSSSRNALYPPASPPTSIRRVRAFLCSSGLLGPGRKTNQSSLGTWPFNAGGNKAGADMDPSPLSFLLLLLFAFLRCFPASADRRFGEYVRGWVLVAPSPLTAPSAEPAAAPLQLHLTTKHKHGSSYVSDLPPGESQNYDAGGKLA